MVAQRRFPGSLLEQTRVISLFPCVSATNPRFLCAGRYASGGEKTLHKNELPIKTSFQPHGSSYVSDLSWTFSDHLRPESVSTWNRFVLMFHVEHRGWRLWERSSQLRIR